MLKPARCAAALLMVDLVFVLLFLIQVRAGTFPDRLVMITWDRSVPEFFQYAKLGVLVVLGLLMFRAVGHRAYLVFAGVVSLLLFDDALRLHEQTGRWWVALFDLQAVGGLQAKDVGEVVSITLIAGVVGLLMIWSYWRSGRREHRFWHLVLMMFAVLAVFGVVGDVLHAMTNKGAVEVAAAVFEDGGEMAAVSALVGVVLAHAARVGVTFGGKTLPQGELRRRADSLGVGNSRVAPLRPPGP